MGKMEPVGSWVPVPLQGAQQTAPRFTRFTEKRDGDLATKGPPPSGDPELRTSSAAPGLPRAVLWPALDTEHQGDPAGLPTHLGCRYHGRPSQPGTRPWGKSKGMWGRAQGAVLN